METDSPNLNFTCKLGLLTRPDGSVVLSEGNTTVIAGIYGPIEVRLKKLQIDKASVECHYRPKCGLPGNTTVIAGIYGPIEVRLKKLQIDKASVECHYRPKCGLPGVEDRLYESIIRNICETSLVVSLYPRTSIIVTIQELQDSGQLISCAINAACLACLNAGIDMKFMFAAVTCHLSVDEELSLSPLSAKETKAMFVFVFDSRENRIIASHTKGIFSKNQFEEAAKISAEGSSDVFAFFKKVVLESF